MSEAEGHEAAAAVHDDRAFPREISSGLVPHERPLGGETFAARFLTAVSSQQGRVERGLPRRFAVSLGLAALYGLALGARYGVVAMLLHGLGVPLAFVAVAVFGVPTFYILLAHSGCDVRASSLASTVTDASATAALVLAGLAPAVALLTVSAESDTSAALAGGIGLLAAGGLGLRQLGLGMRQQLRSSEGQVSLLASTSLVAFALFATLLAGRVWWLTLPMLGGS